MSESELVSKLAMANSKPLIIASADEKPYTPTAFVRFSCASTAAMIAEFITYPLEAMIIRLQMQEGFGLGMFGMLKHVTQTEGVTTLWQGASPALMRQIVTGGIGVGCYPIVRKFYQGDNDSPKLYQRIAAGSTTGTFAQFIAQPLDIVKVRKQMQGSVVAAGGKPLYKGTVDAFIKIGKSEGVAGFFRGLSPSLFRAAAQYGAGTATYDTAKYNLVRTWGLPDTTPTHMLSSAISGFATAVVGCPADVIKTRMIAQTVKGGDKIYTGTLDCIMKTCAQDGVRGMYKGFIPTWMRLAPWQMIFFVAFEKITLTVTGHTFPTK